MDCRNNFVLCIPTYGRPRHIEQLLNDLLDQSASPGSLGVVDGDPSSGEVREMLETHEFCKVIPTWWIPSNHANLPFQRYLGWLFALRENATVLGFLDDDLRISRNAVLHTLLQPFDDQDHPGPPVVGVTAQIAMEEERGKSGRSRGSLSHENNAGEITPGGHRYSLGERCDGESVPVRWFRGGVIFLRMGALDASVFSHDLFAMYEKRVGKGEDSVLGLRVSSRGAIVHFHIRGIVHPNSAPPVAYPASGFARAKATAYSRRLINDNLRYPGCPTLGDRLGLLKSYVGTTGLLFWNALASPSRGRFAEVVGFASGAAAGLMVEPSAEHITPGVNWEEEAEQTMKAMTRVSS